MRDRKIIPMKIPPLEEIKDSPFCCRYLLPGEEISDLSCSELIDSVSRYGIISPPLVAPSGTVILGHRRLAAALAAGLKEAWVIEAGRAPGLLVEKGHEIPRYPAENRGGDLSPFIPVWIEDLLCGMELSPLEQIIFLGRTTRFYPDDLSPVAGPVSRIFGRAVSAEISRDLLSILDYDNTVLDAVHRGTVSPADILLLSRLASVRISDAVRLLTSQRLSRARQKDAVRLISYLADQGDNRWESFLASYDNGPEPLPDLLRRACYPRMSSDSLEIERVISDIRLPQNASIAPPDNLEGGGYRLSVRIRDEKNLRSVLGKILSAVDDGKIAKLLAILKR
ncbi:MAG: hypothetical protein JW814_06575 [Candidatus Krumholzibacteriota bacterium]|nr:hypothetical protein [Candidatus Krumholzibacteriota bacterium]